MGNKHIGNEFREDALSKRYFFRLSAGFIGSGIGAVIQLMVPRSLGPAVYGDFNFMTVFFSNLILTLSMGSATWFYIKLSRNRSDKKIIIFYRYIIAGLVFIVLSFVIIATLTPIHQKIWIGQSINIIYLAMIWAIMDWLLRVEDKVVDAYALTVNAEKARILQRIIGLLIIFILFILNKLNIITFFIYHYFIIALLLFLYLIIIRRKGFSTGLSFSITKKENKEYFKDLYIYANPLVIYSLTGLAVAVLDRWLLQKYGGSVQQGYFSLAYRIGAIYFLFASSLTQLLTREFSVAFGKKDINSMKILFNKYIPLVYGIVAYFACFVAIQFDKIVFIIGGSEYKNAGIAMIIMAFYPIHQTYGQLSSSVFFATGQTRIYRNIGISGMLIGLPLIYFLLAPRGMMGLDAGAVGLAVKMVLLQLILVNVGLYFNTKFLGLSFPRFLLSQFVSIAIMIIIALGSKLGVDSITILGDNVILSFILSGIVYTVLIVIIGNFFPKIFGLEKETIQRLKAKLVKWANNIINKIKK